VFLCYASKRGNVLLDRELYLPQDWVEDGPRCRAAGIPEGVQFATKPMLGKRMLERAFQTGVPCGWVAGDEVYGRDSKLRRWLEERHQPFVLAVAADQLLWQQDMRQHRVDGHAGLGRVDRTACRGEKNLPSRKFLSAYPKSGIGSLCGCGAAGIVWSIFCFGLTGEDSTNSSPSSTTTKNEAPCFLPLTYNCSTIRILDSLQPSTPTVKQNHPYLASFPLEPNRPFNEGERHFCASPVSAPARAES
jgi:hypothetical protein